MGPARIQAGRSVKTEHPREATPLVNGLRATLVINRGV
jgi:hypothetical protein